MERGEYAFEYLHWTSEKWRGGASTEGEDDEIAAIGEAQWHLSRPAYLKLDCGFGITSKAPGIAPGIGVMLSF